mmetsp:Transcript_22521/g.64355  ORF Transcript_22521/g.64355 Transcript_22521/m.64355 type:complete len:116 (-) Transcript_22521:364-711(-)
MGCDNTGAETISCQRPRASRQGSMPLSLSLCLSVCLSVCGLFFSSPIATALATRDREKKRYQKRREKVTRGHEAHHSGHTHVTRTHPEAKAACVVLFSSCCLAFSLVACQLCPLP